jgi:leader peptidase (prepilin peptidase) / N-methyltransferase
VHVALSAVAGLLAGPLIHHVAVQAGADLPFGVGAGVCRRCGAPNSLLASCSSCGLRITRAIATALLTSILSGLIAMALGPVWVLIPYLGFAAMTVALFLTDVDHKRIPNRITYPGTPLLAGLLMLGAVGDGTLSSFPRALLGALAYAGFFGMVYLVARGGFGFGDVKLAVSLGLFTGFLGWDRLLLAGMATAAVGGLVALAAVLGGSAGAKSEIPYGPPMIVGTWISIIGGERLVQMLL